MSFQPLRCESPRDRSPSDATDVHCMRPFTTSDTRSVRLLAVHVHFGRHLDRLRRVSVDSKLRTFVVLTVENFPISAGSVECVHAVLLHGDNDRPLPYTRTYSPFAATRVVEDSTSPDWNELLTLTLPAQEGQPLVEHGMMAQPIPFTLKLELVERGVSQQEDFLLGKAILPLKWPFTQQRRFATSFQEAEERRRGDSALTPLPCIYISVQKSSYSTFAHPTYERVEVLLQSFTFTNVSKTDGEDEWSSLAVLLQSSDALSSTAVLLERETLEEEFELVTDGIVISAQPSSSQLLSCLSPSARRSPGSDGCLSVWWQFPFVFDFVDGGAADKEIDVIVYSAGDQPHKQIGRGRLMLKPSVMEKNGSNFTVDPPIAIYVLRNDKNQMIGQFHLSLRWWDPTAWERFLSEARRVVCTNRWKCQKESLEWMGALFRGLNRHPVSSFCDEGGISSVLAAMVRSNSISEDRKPPLINGLPSLNTDHNAGKSAIDQVLTDQLAHLQQESVAQREQIQRLQGELDARLAAIKACGLELVTLRRELRHKDEQLQQRTSQLVAMEQREQKQLEELTQPYHHQPGAHLDSQTAQRFMLLVMKYKELDQQNQLTKKQLDEAMQSLAHYRELEKRYTELEQAHLIQAAQVQRLQREKQEVAVLKKAVRMQEHVIRQFEQTVAMHSVHQDASETQVKHLPSTTTNGTAATGRANQNGEQENEESLLAVRVRVLEEQLETNARQAASEISALKMKLFRLETGGH